MKLECDCGNTDPTRFSIQEKRVVWLSVDHKDGVFLQPGWDVKEELTTESLLYCDDCNTTQELR